MATIRLTSAATSAGAELGRHRLVVARPGRARAASSVTDSVKASAARSRAVKNGVSAPGGQRVQALLGLADGPGVLGVHVDAVGAAVELGGADADQLAQLRVEARPGRVPWSRPGPGGPWPGRSRRRGCRSPAGPGSWVVVAVSVMSCRHAVPTLGHEPRSKVQFHDRKLGHFRAGPASGAGRGQPAASGPAWRPRCARRCGPGGSAPGVRLPSSRALAADLGWPATPWPTPTASWSPRAG